MKDRPTISFIVPTIGRDSLKETLASIEKWPGDEVLVIRHTPPSGNWGNAERQEGTDKAKCDYLAYMDDDDKYVFGHRAIMDQATRENPNNYPILFKMKYPSGRILWFDFSRQIFFACRSSSGSASGGPNRANTARCDSRSGWNLTGFLGCRHSSFSNNC